MMTAAALVLFLAQAAKPQPATDPEKAGPDFKVQGEYERDKVGAQVVALGDGNFDVVVYPSGFPGTGLGRTLIGMSKAKTEGKITTVTGSPRGRIEDGVLELQGGDEPSSKLKRVERKSPTEGAKPPEGAVVLFDGKNADEWEKGKLVEGNLLYCGTKTKKAFRDVKLHVEFRNCWGPKWPDRSNSGVYLSGCHEVQIIDSFGKPDPGTGDCGGIYETAKPKVNMCFPPLQWQTFDIEYRAPRWEGGKKVKNAVMTVDHNGVRIHENVEVPKATRANILPEADAPGPIHLQDHGSPVVFRNIWAVELK